MDITAGKQDDGHDIGKPLEYGIKARTQDDGQYMARIRDTG